jgi:hypothetical protein
LALKQFLHFRGEQDSSRLWVAIERIEAKQLTLENQFFPFFAY